MSIENNIKKEVADLRRLAENELTIYRKLDELIELLSKSDIDSETAKTYQKRLDKALQKQIQKKTVTSVSAPKEPVDVDDVNIFLTSNHFESKLADEKTFEEAGLSKYALYAVCAVTLSLGFSMFIMPNSPVFSKLNAGGDSINLLTILALLLTLTGVCFLIIAIYRKPNRSKYKHD